MICRASSTTRGGVIFLVPDVRVDVPILTTMSMGFELPMKIGRNYTCLTTSSNSLNRLIKILGIRVDCKASLWDCVASLWDYAHRKAAVPRRRGQFLPIRGLHFPQRVDLRYDSVFFNALTRIGGTKARRTPSGQL